MLAAGGGIGIGDALWSRLGFVRGRRRRDFARISRASGSIVFSGALAVSRCATAASSRTSRAGAVSARSAFSSRSARQISASAVPR
jgi:hypothetical protein